MYLVSKKFRFEACHSIEGHLQCGRKHGHSYELIVTLMSDKLNPKTGMVIDFSSIKMVVNRKIVSIVDHSDLDEIFPFVTTAERLAKKFYDDLKDSFGDVRVHSITVNETVNNSAVYIGNQNESK